LWAPFSHLLTLSVVVFALIFFRAQSIPDAMVFLHRIFTFAHDGTRLMSLYILSAAVPLVLIHLIVNKDRNLAEELPRMSLAPQITGYAGLLFLLVVLGSTDSGAFIYFQF